MTVPTFKFDSSIHGAFEAQTFGTDPYTPGRRSRLLLSEILGWGIDLPAFAEAWRNVGVALLTNLPLDRDLPLSPADGKRHPDKRSVVSEGLLNAVSFALGLHPVAFHNEKDGDLIHQIVPIPGRETSISNQGAFAFAMHTEGTHLPMPPHALALICVRNTEMGATNFVALDRAMRDASPHILSALRRPGNYTLPISESYGRPGERYTIPLITGPEDAPLYRVDFTDVEATSAEAKFALDYFRRQAIACEDAVALQPGQMVVLNNHRTLHGRVGFTPDYSEGKQRWLQRQYMTADPFAGEPGDIRYPHVWRGG